MDKAPIPSGQPRLLAKPPGPEVYRRLEPELQQKRLEDGMLFSRKVYRVAGIIAEIKTREIDVQQGHLTKIPRLEFERVDMQVRHINVPDLSWWAAPGIRTATALVEFVTSSMRQLELLVRFTDVSEMV